MYFGCGKAGAGRGEERKIIIEIHLKLLKTSSVIRAEWSMFNNVDGINDVNHTIGDL